MNAEASVLDEPFTTTENLRETVDLSSLPPLGPTAEAVEQHRVISLSEDGIGVSPADVVEMGNGRVKAYLMETIVDTAYGRLISESNGRYVSYTKQEMVEMLTDPDYHFAVYKDPFNRLP